MKVAKVFSGVVQSLLLSSVGFQITDLSSSSKRYPNRADRFIVKMDYCGSSFFYHVLLNQFYPSFPPDFIMDIDQMNQVDHLKTIEAWDIHDEQCLLNIFLEIRDNFHDLQIQRLNTLEKPKIQFDISTIDYLPGVEFVVDSGEVKVSIPLTNISFSLLSPNLKNYNEEFGFLKLILTYGLIGSDFPMRYIKIPKEWIDHDPSGVCDTLRDLPPWDSEFLLTEYIEEIKDSYEKKLTIVSRRKDMLDSIAKTFGTALEYDDVHYKKISFISDTSTYVILVTVSLSDAFPDKAPVIRLTSLIHWGRTKEPFTRAFNDYRYSPRWTNEEMIKRIKSFLKESVGPFSKACTKVQ